MARRRIPAATATLREIARVRAATGNHGKGRHPISKKYMEALKEYEEGQNNFKMEDMKIDYSDIPSQAGKPFKRVNP